MAKNKTRTTIRPLTITLSLVAAFLALILWLMSAAKLSYERPLRFRGKLEATVSFIGVPCPPLRLSKTPPCDGPYPDYPVAIRDKQSGDIVVVALTDPKGKLSLELPTGFYYWEPKERGPLGKTNRVDFSIQTNQTTTAEFVIDTGIR